MLRGLEAAVKHFVLGMRMGQQLSPHLLKQTISFPSILPVGDGFEQRRHFLVVIIEVPQDTFCNAEHFFNYRVKCLSLRGIC